MIKVDILLYVMSGLSSVSGVKIDEVDIHLSSEFWKVIFFLGFP